MITLAKAFPASQFHGYEISASALEAAHQRLRSEPARINNVTFHNVALGDTLPDDGSLHFIIVNDAIHDMTQPKPVMRAIRNALHDTEGVWVAIEPGCGNTLAENVKHPMVSA